MYNFPQKDLNKSVYMAGNDSTKRKKKNLTKMAKSPVQKNQYMLHLLYESGSLLSQI